jgi:hypothetical protein
MNDISALVTISGFMPITAQKNLMYDDTVD